MRALLRIFVVSIALAGMGAATAQTVQAAKARSACANRLCTRDVSSAPSCWRFDDRKRVSRCFIRRAATHYRQPSGEALAIAHRESRYDYRVTNRSSGAAGLFQFMPRTWRFTPYRHKSPHNPRWAALGAMWMWRQGYKSHWSL